MPESIRFQSSDHPLANRGVDSSQTRRPSLPPVEDSNDLKPVATQPVGDHVRCARYDQFSRTGNPTRTGQIGQLGEPLESFGHGERMSRTTIAGLHAGAENQAAGIEKCRFTSAS